MGTPKSIVCVSHFCYNTLPQTQWLNIQLYYLRVVDVRNPKWVTLGQNQSISKASQGFSVNLYACLFHLLEAACIPWPIVLFIQLQSQQWLPASLRIPSLWYWVFCLPLPHLKSHVAILHLPRYSSYWGELINNLNSIRNHNSPLPCPRPWPILMLLHSGFGYCWDNIILLSTTIIEEMIWKILDPESSGMNNNSCK